MDRIAVHTPVRKTMQMDHQVSVIAGTAVAPAVGHRGAALPRAGRPFFGIVIALMTLAGVRPASAASYTITVDASKKTAGNPHFWSASVGTGVGIISVRS